MLIVFDSDDNNDNNRRRHKLQQEGVLFRIHRMELGYLISTILVALLGLMMFLGPIFLPETYKSLIIFYLFLCGVIMPSVLLGTFGGIAQNQTYASFYLALLVPSLWVGGDKFVVYLLDSGKVKVPVPAAGATGLQSRAAQFVSDVRKQSETVDAILDSMYIPFLVVVFGVIFMGYGGVNSFPAVVNTLYNATEQGGNGSTAAQIAAIPIVHNTLTYIIGAIFVTLLLSLDFIPKPYRSISHFFTTAFVFLLAFGYGYAGLWLYTSVGDAVSVTVLPGYAIIGLLCILAVQLLVLTTVDCCRGKAFLKNGLDSFLPELTSDQVSLLDARGTLSGGKQKYFLLHRMS